MEHLFIVNPVAFRNRGRVSDQLERIEASCSVGDAPGSEREERHTVHVSRWSRDAVEYVRRFVSQSSDIVRVHSMGGSGTLFEVVNGTYGLPNAEVAVYPLGRSNSFIRYFRRKSERVFNDIGKQVRAGTLPVDVMHNGVSYGLVDCLFGTEAEALLRNPPRPGRTPFPPDSWYRARAMARLRWSKPPDMGFRIILDGEVDISGRYASVAVVNAQRHVDEADLQAIACPDDGLLDVYTFASSSRWGSLREIPLYAAGRYRRIPDACKHYRCRAVEVVCKEKRCSSLDGEVFIVGKKDFSVKPGAIRLAIPEGVGIPGSSTDR